MSPGKKRSQDIEALVFETALKLFTEKGYFNTSVHDIQKEAQVSIGSIYHYFKNKEAIATAIYSNLITEMETAIKEIKDSRHTLHDRGRAVIDYFFDLAENEPNAMHYLLYATHKEFMPEEKSICASPPFEIIREMVREGIENEEIRNMDQVVASASLIGGALRLIRLDLDCFLERPLSSYVDEIWDCAWASVKK
ncbi:TetR/AcrR family transcriptional regulator [Desulfogranum japonicum]|uniref:TetR/AcrR family transcriptional regulator n=1 Tax=Desulfogranum japonicum TaxID=231447 RepID=UPI0003FA98B0|nr:TetR/AcrR family transcriptional regulator [Desulfogranum japonicum]